MLWLVGLEVLSKWSAIVLLSMLSPVPSMSFALVSLSFLLFIPPRPFIPSMMLDVVIPLIPHSIEELLGHLLVNPFLIMLRQMSD